MIEWSYDAHNIYLFIITRVYKYRSRSFYFLALCDRCYVYMYEEATVKQAYSTFYVINIVFQAIFTLLWQIATALIVGWLLVEKIGAPIWVYVPLILVGVVSGLVSMVRFILAAMKSLERIEEQKRKKKKSEDKSNGKQE